MPNIMVGDTVTIEAMVGLSRLKGWIRGDNPDSALWISSDDADQFGKGGERLIA